MRTFKIHENTPGSIWIRLYENGSLAFTARVTDAAMGALLGGAWMNSNGGQ